MSKVVARSDQRSGMEAAMGNRSQPLSKRFAGFRKPGRAVASAAVVRDGAVLMVRDASGERNLPGGRARRGEPPATTAIREMREETGLWIGLDGIAGDYHYVSRGGRPRVRHVFWGTVTHGRLLCDGREIAEARWFPLAEALALPDEALAKPALLRRILSDVAASR